MKKCFFSQHIHLSKEDEQSLMNDIQTYNKIKRTVVNQKKYYDTSSRSLFLHMRDQFDNKTIFINSALREAEASIRSYEELKKLRIQEMKEQIKTIKKKIKTTKKRMNALMALKESLIHFSRAVKQEQKRLPSIKQTTWERYEADGSFSVVAFGKVKASYGNMYDFEMLYLMPKIKGLKSRIRNLKNRLDHKEHRLQKLTNEESWSICFGSKSLFHKRDTVYDDHSVWRRQWQKKRNCSMLLSGRKDLVQGNALVRYDTTKHVLSYTTQDGRKLSFFCTFPKGQEEIEDALNCRNGYEKQAIAWSFERTGSSFIVKCLLTTKEVVRNMDYSSGVIGFDTNYDNISVSETDGHGNLLKHKVFPFDIENKTQEQVEHILSDTLEKVFQWADKTHKPVVMEDLSIKKRGEAYQGKKRNRKLSLFASTKITELAESKAYKYHIDMKKVFPAYTSIMGKGKYMARYGLSIHESASFVIARRGMGYKEKLPQMWKPFVKLQYQQESLWKQWKQASKRIKESDNKFLYSYQSIASEYLSY